MRHMLKVVYEYHRIYETQIAVFTIENNLAIQLVGDKLQNLLNDWIHPLACHGTPTPKVILKPLLLRQLPKSAQLKEEIAHYERSMPGSFDNSYNHMCRSLVRRIELNRQQQLRASILAHMGEGYDVAPIAPRPKAIAKGKAKGKKGTWRNRSDGGNASGGRSRSISQRGQYEAPQGLCFSLWNPGSCPKNECAYEHRKAPTSGNKDAGKSKPRVKSGSRTRSQGPSGSKHEPCRSFTTGTCHMG